MKKIMIAIITVALVSTIVIIFSVKKEKETVSDKVYVRLKWIYQAQFAGFFTAEKKGLYKEN